MHSTITVSVSKADKDNNPYFYVPFEVDDGVTRIDVSFQYPKADDCIIDLGCFDPSIQPFPSETGFRGWSGGARDSFFIATDDATPGYIHGPIEPGTWQIIFGLYKVPDTDVNIILKISLDRSPREIAPQPVRANPVRKGAGWYKGDLHCHTFHSDAKGSPELLHAAARQAGLDFLAVSDHNTISQRRYFYPNSSPDLLFIRAFEITTAEGHANVFGTDEWIDFRMTNPSDSLALIKDVHQKDGLLSINHDKPTIPWQYEVPQSVDCMEVWQSTWLFNNGVSLARYQLRLASGMQLSCIGGSDFHQPDRLLPEGPLTLARPTTVLWLEELSEEAVLSALKNGHGYITESPYGPELIISANGKKMGEMLNEQQVAAQVITSNAKGDLLHWYDATGKITEQIIESDQWIGHFQGKPKGFLRTEIVAKKNHQFLLNQLLDVLQGKPFPDGISIEQIKQQPIRRAISNPVYISNL